MHYCVPSWYVNKIAYVCLFLSPPQISRSGLHVSLPVCLSSCVCLCVVYACKAEEQVSFFSVCLVSTKAENSTIQTKKRKEQACCVKHK